MLRRCSKMRNRKNSLLRSLIKKGYVVRKGENSNCYDFFLQPKPKEEVKGEKLRKRLA